jgi:phosphoglycerate kinase
MKNPPTLHGVDVRGKCVLVRVDFNVPFSGGKISDVTRLEAVLPTVSHLVSEGARVVLMSHLGRPDPNSPDPSLSLAPVAEAFSELLERPVQHLSICVGEEAESVVASMADGDVLMLENTRFFEGEKKNDPEFAQGLASLGDLFVSDAFGTVHRAHASTVGVAELLPSYAGFLLEKEIAALTPLLEHPEHPLLLIAGGAKIDTKIGIIKNFLDKADVFIIGGGLANTFLFAEGFDVGESLYESDKLEVAQEIMLAAEAHKEKFMLPEDVIVADEISDAALTLDIPVEDVELAMKILDVGMNAISKYVEAIKEARVIVWNGPVGLYEMKPFERGTKEIAKAVSEATAAGATSILGGGDTIDAIKRFGHSFDEFTHVSTGGGAMLEFLEGKRLPGIEALG